MRKLVTSSLLAALALCVAAAADARPSYPRIWLTVYRDSATLDNVVQGTGSECQLCHASISGGNPWNAYGWSIRTEWEAGAAIEDAINIVAGDDSDLDPTASTNDGEISLDTQPGWTPGPNNTIFFKDLSTMTDQEPPGGILGLLDPDVPPSPLACDVETTQAVYVDGDTLVLSTLRFQNTSAANEPVRMRLQFGLPNGAVVDAIDVGQGGGFSLPAGFDNNFGPLVLFTVSPGIPRGGFSWSCSLEDATTGDVLAEDFAPFEVQ
jgi:hypothetical protein